MKSPDGGDIRAGGAGGKERKMKNREKWAKEIIDIALGGDQIALKDGEPRECMAQKCDECDLDIPCREGNAGIYILDWAEREAEERCGGQ